MSNKKKFTLKKLILAISTFAITGAANAGYTLKLDDDNSLTFGGYIKVDTRYVDGNIASTDYWYGGGTVLDKDQSNIGISVNETRFNTKYVHGDVTGFIEMDFYGDAVSGGGNEVISNSSKPRLRHAFIKYKSVLVGQTWTTFQNTSALAEAADFGGPLVSAAFIRQGQIRYTNGGLQLSIENPESYGGYRGSKTTKDDSVPDFIGKYTFKGDWGNVSVSALARQLKSASGNSESAFGYGIAGRINTVGKDDFRFQLHGGNVGRYVGVVASTDMVGEEVEETTAISIAYRHFWTDDMRSSVFYGNTQTEESDRDRSHWGVNLFKNFTKQLSFGLEVGNFEMAEQNADSNYIQLSAKYVL
jgi:hypothetical protein